MHLFALTNMHNKHTVDIIIIVSLGIMGKFVLKPLLNSHI